MRPRTLLLLAAVVGALLAILYLAGDKVASTDERAAAAKRLLPVKGEEIVALELEWQGTKVRFERAAKPPQTASAKDAGPTSTLLSAPAPRPWRITEPFVKMADSAAVDRFAGELAGLETVRELAGAKRAEVGLAPPRGRVSWKTPGAGGELEIGGSVPASHDLVVAVSGRPAPAVVADTLIAELSRPPGDWRSREVVAATRDRIERVTLRPSPAGGAPGAPGGGVVLGKSGETLRLESPVTDFVDRDLADGLLADLTGLRMETFLDPPLPADVEAALANRAGVVEVALAGGKEPLAIEVGGERAPGKRVWRAGDQVFESASKLRDDLVRPALDWRSRSWTRFENWRIEKVRVEEAAAAGKPAATFELARSQGEWLRDGKKIPFTAVSDLLYALTAAKADRLAETPAPPPGGPAAVLPALTVTLSDADGNEETLTLEPGGEATVVARTRGRNVTLLLPRKQVEDLEAKIAAVRAAAPVIETGARPN